MRKSPDSSPSVEQKSDPADNKSERKCLACGYAGEMKTWIANYTAPKLILVAGFLLGYIPGLIFLAMYWGKPKCPSCGAIGKSRQIKDAQ